MQTKVCRYKIRHIDPSYLEAICKLILQKLEDRKEKIRNRCFSEENFLHQPNLGRDSTEMIHELTIFWSSEFYRIRTRALSIASAI